jgi:hypothetical protein
MCAASSTSYTVQPVMQHVPQYASNKAFLNAGCPRRVLIDCNTFSSTLEFDKSSLISVSISELTLASTSILSEKPFLEILGH